jgi:hypothetical protein
VICVAAEAGIVFDFCPTRAFTLSSSIWLSKGLVTWSSARAARARFSSKASNVPASSTTGMCWVFGSLLSASHTSYPLFPGIITSARTTSGRSSRHRAIASNPLSTVVTWKSSVAKIIPMTLRMVSESSATSRFFGISVGPRGHQPPEFVEETGLLRRQPTPLSRGAA